MTVPKDVRSAAAEVRLLVLDVDGVLTDGRLYYTERGETLKGFHVRDGLGLRMLREEGIEVAVISGRDAGALSKRLADLKITLTYLGRNDKTNAFSELLERTGCPSSQVAFVGDDVLDLPVMRRVGVPVAVADGHPAVLAEARWVTSLGGGRGAVREVADGLLAARGRLDAAVQGVIGSENIPG